MYKKLSNGQFYDQERQTFFDWNPILQGKTVMTSDGLLNFMEYDEFLTTPEGFKAVIPAVCVGLENRGKTHYANFFDFEYINTGKRPINNVWVDFNNNFEIDKCYALKVIKNNSYPAKIKVLKKFVIKK